MGSRTGGPQEPKAFGKVVGKFSSHYNDRFDDQAVVTEAERKVRQDTVAQVVDAYYDFASLAYEINWSTHFHYTPFPPTYPASDSTLATALQFYENRFALLTNLRPGMKVLDIGCGIGGPARAIARFIGCTIVGITINQGQVDRAIYLTQLEGLQDKCTFVQGDFLDLPFQDQSFDAAYAIEATVHAPSLLTVYKEVARVLKPGAPFGTSEWVLTPNFDVADPKHIAIQNRLERGNGLVNLHTSRQAREAFLEAGFSLEHEEDYAEHFDYAKDLLAEHDGQGKSRGKDVESTSSTLAARRSPILVPFLSGLAPAPPSSITLPSRLPVPKTIYRSWTFPLEGHHHLATTWTDWWLCWKMSRTARRIFGGIVWVGERVGFVRKGVTEATRTMAFCVDSSVEAGKRGIFSPCWWFIGRKMEDGGKGEGIGTGNAGVMNEGELSGSRQVEAGEDLSVLMY